MFGQAPVLCQKTDSERKVLAIRVRAERRAGELLRETAKDGTRAKSGGESKKPKELQRSTLSKYGVSKDQSSDWQKLAAIPKKRFDEAHMRKC